MKLPLCALLCLSTTALLQAQNDTLLFTTLNQGGAELTLSGSSGTSLAKIDSQDVAAMVPEPNATHSAEKLATRTGWSTLTGDANGNGVFFESVLFGQIDAVLARAGTSPNARTMFVSPAVRVGGPGCPFTWEPGDVAGIDIGGVPRVFITEQQVRQAFQIPLGRPANVDAIERDRFGNIALSLEDNVTILGAIPAADGAILGIPAAAISYVNGLVAGVVPGSGMVLFDEAGVDVMVLTANVANPTLGVVTSIGDVDGLCEDPQGGTFWRFKEQYGQVTFAHLLFSGARLMGGGVLTTSGGGAVAVVNGDTLATFNGGSWLTDGSKVGLDPTLPNVGSLNGLELVAGAGRFVLDTPTPMPVAGGNLQIDAGGADAGAPVVMLLGVGPTAPCGVQVSLPFANAGFPDLYPFAVGAVIGVADARGIATLAAPYAGGAPAGVTVTYQAVSFVSGQVALSAPVTQQF